MKPITNTLSPLGYIIDITKLLQLTLNTINLAKVIQLYLEHRTLSDDLNNTMFIEEYTYEFRFNSNNL